MRRDGPIALLGASGLTGALVAEVLAGQGAELVLAARGERALRRLALRLPGRHQVMVVDAADDDAMRRLAGAASVLVDCAGPYGALGPASARAAIAAGTHMVDVTGEQPHARACAALDDEARRAGVALVNGGGVEVAPTDCAAAVAAAGMTRVERIAVAGAARHFVPGRGSRLSALRMCGDEQVALEARRLVPRRLGDRVARLPMAPPFGTVRAVSIPGLEHLTLPRHLPVDTVQTWAALPTPAAAAGRVLSPVLPALARSGRLEPLVRAWPDPRQALDHALFQLLVLVWPDAAAPPAARVIMDGRDVYRSTARIVAWIATSLRDRGPACGHGGALAPAQAVDPHALLSALPDLGIQVDSHIPGPPPGVDPMRDRIAKLGRKVLDQFEEAVEDIVVGGVSDAAADVAELGRDLKGGPPPLPVMRPSQPNLPDYVDASYDPSCPVPGSLEYATGYSSFLQSDHGCLQAMLDRFLTKPCGGKWTFHPLSVEGEKPIVAFVVNQCFLTAAGDDARLGWGRYSEATLVVPTWIEPADELMKLGLPPLQFFMPYIWVSLAPGMASGRESWGYRKTMAEIRSPIAAPPDVNNFEVFTLAQLAARRSTEAMVPLVRGRFELPAQVHRKHVLPGADLQLEMIRSLARILTGHVEDHTRRRISIGGLVKEVDLLAHLFAEQSPTTIYAINLKQFRDTGDTNKACYQALVSSPMTMVDMHGFALLDASACHVDFALSPANYSIRKDFGLPEQGCIEPVGAMYMEVDFRADPGTVIWRWGA